MKGNAKAEFTSIRLNEANLEAQKAETNLRIFLNNNRNYLATTDPAIRLNGIRLENELKIRYQLVGTLTIALEQALLDGKNDIEVLNILDPGNLPLDKSGPARATLVGYAMLAAFLISAVLVHREWIQLWISHQVLE